MSKSLVMYFSCTGNTERVAQTIAKKIQADTYKIVPEAPYTSADLNWNNKNCRANIEQKESSSKPALQGYDEILIGHPI